MRTVKELQKRRNWEDLYIGGALRYIPLGIMLWSVMEGFVDASVKDR